MNYHNITKCDQNNGDGLRVVLWVAGCSHHCKGCQNPQTWNDNYGIHFDEEAENELFEALGESYISGLTLSGGDPLYQKNLPYVLKIVNKMRILYPAKTIWIYTGFTIEEILADEDKKEIVSKCDVLVDGEFEEDKKDVTLHWRGSSNQRVINIKDIDFNKPFKAED